MSLAFFIPILIGALGILQGTLNKQVAGHLGIAQTVLLSNFITFLICVVFYFIVSKWPQHFPALFHIKTALTTFKWWYIFPAIFGFCIVAGMPFAFSKLGAVKVTIFLISSQMVTGVVWDLFVDKLPMTTNKVLAILFAGLSVLFSVI